MKQKKSRNANPLTFRRWDNKGYAVFNSLKKAIRIGCLLVMYFLFANHESIQAQVDTLTVSRNFDLESIDVTSEQLPESYSAMSRVVVSISKSEINRAAVSSVNELLEYVSNIDIRQRGINGMQADISIRGGSFDQVLVLLNGVNITDPQTGHNNLNLPLDLSSIERIEILKGPGSWKFGPGAFSGAINFITKTAKENHVDAAIEVGQYAMDHEQISAGFNIKNTSHSVSFNHSSSDGYTTNTDYRSKNIYYNGNLTTSKQELSVQAGATDKGFGANSFYTATYPDQYEEIQTYFVSAAYKQSIRKVLFEPRIYFRRNNDRFLLFRENPEWYSNYHTTNVFGGNVVANIMHGTRAVTTGGFDSRTETIYSNNLGEKTDHPIQSPVNDTIMLDRYHSRSNLSAFIGHKRYFNRLMINAGVNLSYNTDIEEELFFYPGVDVNYSLNSNNSLFGSVNKTMRMPTYTDLYYNGPNNEGNPDLLPEEALGFEMGYKYKQDVFDLSLTGFHVRGENMIDWVRESLDAKWRTTNYTTLNTSGIEFAFKINLQEAIPKQGLLNELKLNYTYIDQDKTETQLISNYSLNYLKHRIDLNVNFTVWKSIQASWHLAFQDRNGQFEKIIEKESVGLSNYDPFMTNDFKIFWSAFGWNIFASVNNVFNIEYYDIANVVQPGRWYKFGIAKNIDF